MSSGRRQPGNLWFISAGIGFVALALVAMLFRAPRPAPPPLPARGAPALGLGPPKGDAADPLFRDNAAAHDPTPLFLPTQWNSAPKLGRLHADAEPFQPFGADLVFGLEKLNLDLPPSHRVPRRPADALGDNPADDLFLGFGRSDAHLPALSPRGAFVEIVAVGTGRRVFARALTDLPPGEADAPPDGGAWQFMAEVDDAGLVGSLVPKVRSGNAEVDGFFLNYLAKTLRVGERLSPGYYRISVGP